MGKLELVYKNLSLKKALTITIVGSLFIAFLGHLPMIFDAKWQNFCVRKIPMPMPVQAQGS